MGQTETDRQNSKTLKENLEKGIPIFTLKLWWSTSSNRFDKFSQQTQDKHSIKSKAVTTVLCFNMMMLCPMLCLGQREIGEQGWGMGGRVQLIAWWWNFSVSFIIKQLLSVIDLSGVFQHHVVLECPTALRLCIIQQAFCHDASEGPANSSQVAWDWPLSTLYIYLISHTHTYTYRVVWVSC